MPWPGKRLRPKALGHLTRAACPGQVMGSKLSIRFPAPLALDQTADVGIRCARHAGFRGTSQGFTPGGPASREDASSAYVQHACSQVEAQGQGSGLYSPNSGVPRAASTWPEPRNAMRREGRTFATGGNKRCSRMEESADTAVSPRETIAGLPVLALYLKPYMGDDRRSQARRVLPPPGAAHSPTSGLPVLALYPKPCI